jgi:hypothetical protein
MINSTTLSKQDANDILYYVENDCAEGFDNMVEKAMGFYGWDDQERNQAVVALLTHAIFYHAQRTGITKE